MKAVLKKWFPNTLNVVVFVFAFIFVSFCVCGAAIMCWHGTHYKAYKSLPGRTPNPQTPNS